MQPTNRAEEVAVEVLRWADLVINVVDATNLERNLFLTLELLESNGVPYELNRSENILVLRDVGSRILFRSLEEYERLRGTNLAWFGVDELTYTHEEAWLRRESRL